jgi:sugar phosphate isomerase/epimerase
MKIGLHVNAVTFSDKSWPEVCSIVRSLGLETVEPGSGGFVGKSHCNPQLLLRDKEHLEQFVETFKGQGLELSALSCHGNPLHPNQRIAREHEDDIDASIELASKLGLGIVNCFAGSPGLDDDARYPSWITTRWPAEFEEGLKWQWEKKIVPFWERKVKTAREAGIVFGFEMHPGDSIFNPEALSRLREALGADEISCNLDPSHLFWQGINPIVVIRRLGGAIVHVHAKDTEIDSSIMEFKGVNTEALFGDLGSRAWTFRVVGKGHDGSFWKNFVEELRMIGYEHVLSIEHEDPYISASEGIEEAARFLGNILE